MGGKGGEARKEKGKKRNYGALRGEIPRWNSRPRDDDRRDFDRPADIERSRAEEVAARSATRAAFFCSRHQSPSHIGPTRVIRYFRVIYIAVVPFARSVRTPRKPDPTSSLRVKIEETRDKIVFLFYFIYI